MRTRRAGGAALLAGLLLCPLAQAGAPLAVCIAEGTAPLAVRHGPAGEGFDVRVSQAVADALGRPLAIRWFESELDEDASLKRAIDALLSAGLCDLAAGYPLYAPALGLPEAETGRTPDYDGARPLRERPWIKLGTLVASTPYHASALTVIFAPGKARRIGSLVDLAGLRIATKAGTLADALLRVTADGRLEDDLLSLGVTEDAFLMLEGGQVDAALVEVHRLDGYRAAHPDTRIAGSGYLHTLAFNMGFVALATQAALLAQVNAAIDALAERGRLQALAGELAMTYVAPRLPAVRPPITIRTLRE